MGTGMSVMIVVQLIMYAAVTIVGSIGNFAVIVALQRYNVLKNTLDQTTRTLMTLLSFGEFILCFVSTPLRMWNTAVGRQWPFDVPIFCAIANWLLWPTMYFTNWYMLVIAITRLLAAFYPYRHEIWLRTEVVRWAFYLVRNAVFSLGWLYSVKLPQLMNSAPNVQLPIFLGYVVYAVGGFLKVYKIDAVNGTGLCVFVPPDTPNSFATFQLYSMLNTLLEVMVPMGFGCCAYLAIFVQLHFAMRRVQVADGSAVAAVDGGMRARAASVQDNRSRTNRRPSENNVVAPVPGIYVDDDASAAVRQQNGEESLKLRPTAAVSKPANSSEVPVASVSTFRPLKVPRVAVVPHHQQLRQRQLRSIKLLAWAYFINICCMFPNQFLFAAGLKVRLSAVLPGLTVFAELLNVVSFAVNPIVYYFVMPDMRAAYRRLARAVFLRNQIVANPAEMPITGG